MNIFLLFLAWMVLILLHQKMQRQLSPAFFCKVNINLLRLLHLPKPKKAWLVKTPTLLLKLFL
jgi:hypothetical protein